MKRRLLVGLMVVGAMSCSKPTTPMPMMMEEEEEVPFDGETYGGVIPDSLPNSQMPEEDAGALVVDNRCCQIVFSISDVEPADAQGWLRGETGPLAGNGVALVRSAGTWSTSVCMPIKVASAYWYSFSWPMPDGGVSDGGDVDGGAADAGVSDGGMEARVISTRVSDTQPKGYDFEGNLVNAYPTVTDCVQLDASTGTWP